MTCANHPDREHKAFCQNCGKPLCAECARTVGHAVFCEPCLEARLNQTQTWGQAAGTGSGKVSAGPAAASSSYQTVPGAGPASQSPGNPFVVGSAPPPGSPNPGVAFLLGLIPGVGAMYNGQYGKGVVHLIVFAILVSLTDQNGIFGLFVAAWIFYQAIEAYHTARARRDRTPLPKPFGLNDIGERFGFGRAWPGASRAAGFGAASDAPPPPPDPFMPPAGADPASYTQASAAYAASPTGASPYTTGSGSPPPWGAAANAYGTVPPVSASMPGIRRLNFPVGALVLIGLGVLFLLGNSSWFGSLPTRLLLPVLLIGLGGWLFVHRMLRSGTGLSDDGTPAYRLRLLRALQGSIWTVLVGVLFLLDTLHILSWGRSWPLFIIVGGVMVFVQRSIFSSAARAAAYPAYSGYSTTPSSTPEPPPSPAPPPVPGSSITPRDGENL